MNLNIKINTCIAKLYINWTELYSGFKNFLQQLEVFCYITPLHALNSQTQSLEFNNLVTEAFKFSDPC